MLTVYGASDDLIEIEGDVTEEFVYQAEKDGDLLAFSDGTVLKIRYDDDGNWRINPVARGSAQLTINQVSQDEEGYTDRATLDGEVRWVVHGINVAGTFHV